MKSTYNLSAKLKRKFRKKRRKGFTQVYAKIDWDKAIKIFQYIQPRPEKGNSYPSVRKLLPYIAAAGTIGLTFIFPGAAPALGSLLLGKNTYSPWRTKQFIERMRSQKLVEVVENSDGSTSVIITKNGFARALTYQLDNFKINKPKKWDKRWRVIVFDIPEKYRKVRDIFRSRLEQLGLYSFQESVFVYPYPCFNEIEFLREIYGVGVKVKYLLVEKIEDDEYLRDHFDLG